MFNENDIWKGVLSGATRFYQDVEKTSLPTVNLLQPTFELIRKCTQEKQKEWHPRGARLFAETVTVGVMSRWRFGETPLTEEQVFKFVIQSEDFFNCFFHTRFP